MIVHFNKTSGDIIEIINNDHFVQGDMNTHDIDVIFDNSFDNTNYNAYIQFLRQGESTPSPKLVMTPKVITYNNETYRGYSFKVQTSWYTAIAGTLKATIEVKEYTDDGLQSNKAYGIVNIPIENAVDDNPQVDSTITDEEYLALMNLVNAKLNSESDTSNNQTLENPTIKRGRITGSTLSEVEANYLTIKENNSVPTPSGENNIANKLYVDSYTETRVNEKIEALLASGFNGITLNRVNMTSPTISNGVFTSCNISSTTISNSALNNCSVQDSQIVYDTNIVNKKYVDVVKKKVEAIERSYVSGIKTPYVTTGYLTGDVDLTETFNKYLLKSGGEISGELRVNNDTTIGGNLVVNGEATFRNLYVTGSLTTINTSDLYVKDKVVVIGSGNTSTLTSPAGFVVPKYDGVNFGGLFFDSNGIAYVGDVTLDSEGNIVSNGALPLVVSKIDDIKEAIQDKIVVWQYDADTNSYQARASEYTPTSLFESILTDNRYTREYVDEQIALNIHRALLEDY